MNKFAQSTSVDTGRSKEEIFGTLRRYGATSFGHIERENQAAIMFEIKGLTIQVVVALPPASDFQETETGRERTAESARKAHEQAVKQRWRALLLVIKAKLEAVECGIATIEDEFLSYIVMPNGQTLGQQVLPVLKKAVAGGKMPRRLLLPDLNGGSESE